ncbi:FG-GAP repeat protein [Streptomyces sp. 3N207]|uniref:FG-GAP repeat protein n=1 Tax=Streptomyces sp. 3N207 TaxID=3457417 RepID=UPI003FD6168A
MKSRLNHKRDLRIIEGHNPSFGYWPAVGEVNGDDHPDIVVNNPEFTAATA